MWTLLGAYIATLVLFVLPIVVPGTRLWGTAVWVFLPAVLKYTLIALAVAGVFLWWRLKAWQEDREPAAEPFKARVDGSITLAILVTSGVAFWLLRGRTHFLGDGYAQLTRVAAQNPFFKAWDTGEELVRVWLYRLFAGQSAEAALLAYQIAAVLAGLLFILTMAWGAHHLFSTRRERILFLLGMLTTGCSLMFFGYVENYAFLCMAIGAFTVTGLVTFRTDRSRWWILLPLTLAVAMHALGILLLPAAAFVLLGRELPVRRWQRLRAPYRWLVAVAAAGLVVVLAYVGYQSVRFLQLVMLPIRTDAFTLDGYTLFSEPHLIDFANLMLILIPGLLVFAFAGVISQIYHRLRYPEYQFLTLLALTTLTAAFLIEPGLGLPRDWDALSFPGIPLASLLFFTALDGSSDRRVHPAAAALALALALLSLLPRAVTQAIPEQGIGLFRSYASLDIKRNRSGMGQLSNYYYRHGDSTLHQQTQMLRRQWYPEESWMGLARRYFDRRDAVNTVGVARRIVQENPKDPSGWLHLGRGNLLAGQYDSALSYLQLAEALNPGSYPTLVSIGQAYYAQRKPAMAHEAWRQALSLDSVSYDAQAWLGRLAQEAGDLDDARDYLGRAAARPNAPGWVHRRLGDILLAEDNLEGAQAAYADALTKGSNSAAIAQSLQQHPQLLRALGLDTLDVSR